MIIQHRRGDTKDWRRADSLSVQLPEVILKDGEFAIEELENGLRRVRVGDGHSKFFDLPFIDAGAEATAEDLMAKVRDTLQKNIDRAVSDQKATINNIKQQLLSRLSQEYNNLVSAYESADKELLETAIQAAHEVIEEATVAINAEVTRHAADITKINKKISETALALSEQGASTDNRLRVLTNNITTLSNTLSDRSAQLSAQLTAHEEEVSKSIDSAIYEMSTSVLQELSDTKDTIETNVNAKLTKLTESNISINNRLQVLTSDIDAVSKAVLDTSDDMLSKLSQHEEESSKNLSSAISNLATSVNKELTAVRDVVETDVKVKLSKLTDTAVSTNNKLQALSSNIDSVSKTLSDKSEYILSKLDAHEKESSKNLDSAVSDLATTADQKLNSVKATLEATISDELSKQNNKIQTVRASLETQMRLDRQSNANELENVQRTFTDADDALSRTLQDLDKRDAAAIADILSQLVTIKEELLRLSELETTLQNKLYAINNVLTASATKLSTDMTSLTSRHDTEIADLTKNVEEVDAAYKAADEAILKQLNEYLTDIYAELADLVDDDVLILERLYAFRNTFNVRLNNVEAELATTIARFDELEPERLSVVVDRINTKMDEADTELLNKITDVATALSNTDERLTVTIDETKKFLDDRIDLSAKDRVAELADARSALEQNISATEQDIRENLAKTSSGLSIKIDAAAATAASNLAETNKNLTEQLTKTSADLADRIDKTAAELAENLSKAEATLSKEIAETNSTFTAKINALDVDDPTASTAADVSFINTLKQIDGKITATKAPLPVAATDVAGITKLGVAGGAATFEQAKENADDIEGIKQAIAGGTHFRGVTTSELTDGSKINPIVIKGVDNKDTEYTASSGDIVLYGEKEFIWTTDAWKELGDLSRVGTLEAWRADLTTDLLAHIAAFDALTARSLQVDNTNNVLHLGMPADDSVILYCGTSTDI